jgi:septal ring factor EnvC (AmiA/AmiB activator)
MSEAKEQELAQLTAQIKEKHSLIGEHYQEIARLERELRALEDERLSRAPRGTYRHRREDGSEITVEAAVIETEGEAKHIYYQIPRSLARRGEEDAYIRWLRSPEDLTRFMLATKR